VEFTIISKFYKRSLKIAQYILKYIKILQDYLVQYAWARFGPTEDDPVPFVNDRSPIHISHVVQDWFEEEGKEFEVFPWPPKGADLHPIENV
jgi:hypothetical protein